MIDFKDVFFQRSFLIDLFNILTHKKMEYSETSDV